MAGNTLIVKNSRFISNTASAGTVWGLGGGVYAGRAMTVTQSIFERNRCIGSFCTGGGVYAFKTLAANATVFKNNSATNGGGGIYVVEGAELIDDRLEENQGVGLNSDGIVTATGTVVSGNQNSGLRVKAAILVRGRFENNQNFDVVAKTLTLTGTQFSGNTGRAVYLNNLNAPSDSRIVNALFTGYGTAVFMDSPSSNVTILQSTIAVGDFSAATAIVAQWGTVAVTNTIVASHTLGIEQASGTVYQDYNLFYGNTINFTGTANGGTHDVFGNPNFVNPANDDYHIVPPSAAIDAGTDAGVYTDLDGNVRPIGGGFDIGAYEATNVTVPITGLVAVNDSPTRLGNATMFVAFIQAGDSVSYRWDFGDGSALGTYQTVAHTYPAAGIYTAIVTASNSVSVVTATTRVTVDVPLSGLLAVNDSPTLFGNVTTLTATISAGSNVTYTWNFGDSSSTDTGITSTHTYSTVGVYTATVTAVNSVSLVSATTHVTITDVPLSGLSASNNSPTVIGSATTLTATISAGSNVTYTWNFGDGSAAAIGQVVTHIYPFSATSCFTATVTAVNSVSLQSAATVVVIVPKRVYLPLVIR
jgi:predicted outer membrane repeat protein